MKHSTGNMRSTARSVKQTGHAIFCLNVFLFLNLIMVTAGCTQNKEENNMDKIIVNSKIPTFTLQDQNGQPFSIDSVLGKKNLVIYFYPKDDTPGCTKEACSFRDQYEDFANADAIVIGISSDDVESHKDFAEKYNLSFTLLSDVGGKLRKQFGVPTSFLGLLPGRVTYIVDKRGVVIHIFNSQMNATKHIDEALKALGKEK